MSHDYYTVYTQYTYRYLGKIHIIVKPLYCIHVDKIKSLKVKLNTSIYSTKNVKYNYHIVLLFFFGRYCSLLYCSNPTIYKKKVFYDSIVLTERMKHSHTHV